MIQIISLILNALLTSGLLVTIFTIRATRKKASAEASSAEIDNAQKLVNDFDNFIVKPLKSQVDELTMGLYSTIYGSRVHKKRRANKMLTRLQYIIIQMNYL